MNQPKDIVWNAITDSAKTRFDYSEFERAFADFHNDNIAENILFLTIAGHAAEDSTEDIAAEINQQLVLIGYSFADDALTKFISDRQSDLFREIKAMETASALFEMGLQTPGILVQTRSLLAKP